MSELKEFRIVLEDNLAASNLFGQNDENIRFLQSKLRAKITARGNELIITGSADELVEANEILEQLIALIKAGNQITISDINYFLNSSEEKLEGIVDKLSEVIIVTAKGKPLKPKTLGQHGYLQAIRENHIVFGIGPAGTGKTYLAVVMAVKALKAKQVSRIVLTRPAVEAGEKLGFLPGDLQDKVDPYLRPLYDGLFDVLGTEIAQRYLEKNIIEVAPLAYMRGRTLDDSFIILDEAQNTTPEQMKMFLTRIGFGSKAVITGDITQVDLPRNQKSGLLQVQSILKNIDGISFQYLSAKDVVRHPIVQKIIEAYENNSENG